MSPGRPHSHLLVTAEDLVADYLHHHPGADLESVSVKRLLDWWRTRRDDETRGDGAGTKRAN